MATEREKLAGWEQIAEHLGVSVRTAQVYEHEQGLPVHRLPGPKGRVWAFADELDSWRLKSAPDPPDEATDLTSAISVEAQPNKPGAATLRRQVVVSALAGTGVLIGGAVYAFARLGIFKRRPVDWRVNGNTLTVLGDGGRELWHYRFPAEMDLGAYQRLSGRPRCVFTDLDGDGNWEAIFIYYPLDPMRDGWKLVCFSADGNIRWEFRTTRRVVAQSDEWAPPYIPASFVVISPRSGPSRVVVASVHYWSFPCQIAVLDPGGKLVGEFWHRGHLNHIGVADLHGNGAPQVLLGGVNDAAEHKQATLLVFNLATIAGASCSPVGEPYFQGFAPGTQQAEIFFPRTVVSRDQEFNRVLNLQVGTGRITAIIGEGIDDQNTNFVVYDFDLNLNVTNVFLSDAVRARYREMEALGEMQKGSTDGEEERLKKQVRILRRAV